MSLPSPPPLSQQPGRPRGKMGDKQDRATWEHGSKSPDGALYWTRIRLYDCEVNFCHAKPLGCWGLLITIAQPVLFCQILSISHSYPHSFLEKSTVWFMVHSLHGYLLRVSDFLSSPRRVSHKLISADHNSLDCFRFGHVTLFWTRSYKENLQGNFWLRLSSLLKRNIYGEVVPFRSQDVINEEMMSGTTAAILQSWVWGKSEYSEDGREDIWK